MSASLVGSEMCIRDSICVLCAEIGDLVAAVRAEGRALPDRHRALVATACLLYTSDAADDM
eukprot:9046021-Alexandrium_andersonii.AAC.1